MSNRYTTQDLIYLIESANNDTPLLDIAKYLGRSADGVVQKMMDISKNPRLGLSEDVAKKYRKELPRQKPPKPRNIDYTDELGYIGTLRELGYDIGKPVMEKHALFIPLNEKYINPDDVIQDFKTHIEDAAEKLPYSIAIRVLFKDNNIIIPI